MSQGWDAVEVCGVQRCAVESFKRAQIPYAVGRACYQYAYQYNASTAVVVRDCWRFEVVRPHLARAVANRTPCFLIYVCVLVYYVTLNVRKSRLKTLHNNFHHILPDKTWFSELRYMCCGVCCCCCCLLLLPPLLRVGCCCCR